MVNMNVKSIVFVAPSLGGGGAERVAVSLANYFVDNGIEFTFLLTKSKQVAYKIDSRVKVVDKYADEGLSPIAQIKLISQFMKLYSNSLFISFLVHQNMYTLLAKVFNKNKVLISIRNDPRRDFNNKQVFSLARNLLYTLADGVVFQTKEQKRILKFIPEAKSHYILNPITPSLPAPFEGDRLKRIVSVGRLDRQKNHEMTIRAFKAFHDKYPMYKLDIFGDGPSRQSLIEMVEELSLSNCIHFHGFSGDVLDFVNRSVLYVSSSEFEGLSNSMLEALSMGVPTICTDCMGGGAVMVIENGVNGFLIPRDDSYALFKTMCLVVEDEKLMSTVSKNALKLRSCLQIESIASQWLSVFQTL